MSKLPSLKSREVLRALVNRGGFYVHHVTGSHYVLKHPDGRRTTVPYHNKDLKKSTLRNILREAAIPREEFLKML